MNNLEEIDHHLSYKNIVIDVGHFHFIENVTGGGIQNASETILETVKDGVGFMRKLSTHAIETILHICGSDTNKYITKEAREKYSEFHGKVIEQNLFTLLLPKNIATYLIEQNIKKVLFTSQVKNTNSATGLIKKSKKKFKALFAKQNPSCHCLPVSGANNFFGIFSGLQKSNIITYNNEDQRMLRSKNVIGLYGEKGTLCPSSCMGMYSNIHKFYPRCDNIISIYDETDDYTIKKKLFHGCISYIHLTESSLNVRILVKNDIDDDVSDITITIGENLDVYTVPVGEFLHTYKDTIDYYGLYTYGSKPKDKKGNEHVIELDCGCDDACSLL